MSSVRIDRSGRIATVSLDRADKLNAINRELLLDLRAAWDEVAADGEIRVAILRGEGRCFSVGADQAAGSAAEGVTRTVATDREQRRFLLETAFRAWDLPKPVVAQVHGHCLGAATLFPLLSDMIFVAEDANIGWPKLPIGGGMIGPAWSWAVGPYRAKQYSFTVGTAMTGAEAVAVGWGNAAVPAEQLSAMAFEAAERIARLPSELLGIKKTAVNSQFEAQGFKQAIMRGAEFDAISHNTEAVLNSGRQIRPLGLKGAIEWFEAGNLE